MFLTITICTIFKFCFFFVFVSNNCINKAVWFVVDLWFVSWCCCCCCCCCHGCEILDFVPWVNFTMYSPPCAVYYSDPHPHCANSNWVDPDWSNISYSKVRRSPHSTSDRSCTSHHYLWHCKWIQRTIWIS